MHEVTITPPSPVQVVLPNSPYTKESCCNPYATKLTVEAIIAFVAAGAIISSGLFIMAQQGFDLRGINPIAAQIEPSLLYTTLAGSAAVGFIDFCFFVKTVREHQNQKKEIVPEIVPDNGILPEATPIKPAKIKDIESPFLKKSEQTYARIKEFYINERIAAYFTTQNQCVARDITIKGQTLSLLFYKNEKKVGRTRIFDNAGSRDEFIRNKKFQEAPSPFDSAGRYISEYIDKVLCKKHLDYLNNLNTDSTGKENGYIALDIPSKAVKFIYALAIHTTDDSSVVNKNILFFATPEERQQYIDSQAATLHDLGIFNHTCFGVPDGMDGTRGVVKEFHLNELLHNKGDFYTFDKCINGKRRFIAIWKIESGQLKADLFSSGEERTKYLEDNGINRDLTDEVKGYHHHDLDRVVFSSSGIIKAKLIKLIVDSKGKYWIEPQIQVGSKLIDLVFYHDGNSFQTRIFFNSGFDDFIKNEKLVDNVRTSFELLPQYPERLGKFLVNSSKINMSKIEQQSKKCFSREFIKSKSATQVAAYPKVYTLVMRNEQGVVMYRFFKEESGLNEYLKKLSGFRCALVRENNIKKYVEMAGKILAKDLTETSKYIYYIRKSSDGKRFMILTYAPSENVKVSYHPIEALAEKNTALLHDIPLNSKTLTPNHPLTDEELKHLDASCQKYSDRLEPNTYVKKEKNEGHYVAVIARKELEGEPTEIQKKYFRRGDRTIDDFIDQLIVQGIKEAE